MLLKRLTEASGLSGNEKEVRDIIISEIKRIPNRRYRKRRGACLE